MINNRQAGRRRGRGGNNGPGGGGGGSHNGGGGGGQRQGRGDNGNRIDSRARGNASQLYEKYKNMASDAQRQGDRVTTEYYLQFADHYFRVISDQRGRDEPRRDRDEFDGDGFGGNFGGNGFGGNGDDFGDEGDPIRAGEQQMEPRADRDARPDREPRPPREPRADREPRVDDDQRPDRAPRGDRQDRGPREARPDRERPEREPRPDRDARPRDRVETAEVAGQHRADPIEPGESLHARAEAILEADAPLAPRRRGRPRRDAVDAQPDAQPQDDRTEEPALDADRLPPSLLTPANDADGDAKPRRRRLRSPAAETPDAAE